MGLAADETDLVRDLPGLKMDVYRVYVIRVHLILIAEILMPKSRGTEEDK